MIQPFQIALLTHFKRGVYIHLKKAVSADDLCRVLPVGVKRCNNRHKHNHASLIKEPRDFGNAADIFRAVTFREGEVSIQTKTQIITVEPIDMESFRMQTLLKLFRNG